MYKIKKKKQRRGRPSCPEDGGGAVSASLESLNRPSPKGKTQSCKKEVRDLESALLYIVNSWSPTNNDMQREYLWRNRKVEEDDDDDDDDDEEEEDEDEDDDDEEDEEEEDNVGEKNSTKVGGDNESDVESKKLSRISANVNNKSRGPWVTFRLAHAGDVSELARLYRQSKQKACETTSLEVRLAEGLGDEDHPPLVFGLMAFVHEEIFTAMKTPPHDISHRDKTNNPTNPEETEDSEKSETRNPTFSSQLAAVVLLTEQYSDHGSSKISRRISIEWLYAPTDSDKDKIQRSVQSHLWLRLATLGILLNCPISFHGS